MRTRSGPARVGLLLPLSLRATVSAIASAVLLVVLAIPAAAQGPIWTTGWISGRVTDATTGAPLAGVTVSFRTSWGPGGGSATSSASGWYTAGFVTPGNYYLCTSNSLGYFDAVYGGGAPVAGCLWAQGMPCVCRRERASPSTSP